MGTGIGRAQSGEWKLGEETLSEELGLQELPEGGERRPYPCSIHRWQTANEKSLDCRAYRDDSERLVKQGDLVLRLRNIDTNK